MQPQPTPEQHSAGNGQQEAEQHTTPNDQHHKNVETFLKRLSGSRRNTGLQDIGREREKGSVGGDHHLNGHVGRATP